MNIKNDITEAIGRTPLISLKNFSLSRGLSVPITAKVEFFNPTGSAKDRAALYMIEDAEKRGLLKKGSVIIEPTSGNTGIGLAAIAAARGCRAILVMPDTMSKERIKLLKAYGAEVVLTDGKLGMAGSIEKAEELRKKLGGFIPSQFENPANPLSHFETTGPEIYSDTDGKVGAFVAAVGTAGTLCGTARYLKSKNKDIYTCGVEPSSSPLITEGYFGVHKIQGIGANFIPRNYDPSVVDEVLTVTDEEAYAAARDIARMDGLLVGISSGACAAGAAKLASRDELSEKLVVALLTDTGERYLSSGLFEG